MAARRLDAGHRGVPPERRRVPRSANAFDSLGEAYRAQGDRELAIRSYEKALELDPNMRSAIEALKELRSR